MTCSLVASGEGQHSLLEGCYRTEIEGFRGETAVKPHGELARRNICSAYHAMSRHLNISISGPPAIEFQIPSAQRCVDESIIPKALLFLGVIPR